MHKFGIAAHRGRLPTASFDFVTLYGSGEMRVDKLVATWLPTLDRDALSRTHAAIGEQGFTTLLTLFVRDAACRPFIIQSLALIGQQELVRFECAVLRAAAQMFGAQRLAVACAEIERGLNDPCFDAIRETAALVSLADETRVAVEAWRTDAAAALATSMTGLS